LNIKEEDNLELNKPITEEEILATINQFNPNKALGLDGFTIHFYKICWSIIKCDLIWMLQYVHKSSWLGGATNSSFLALIPKEKNASTFDQFRPISLCNVSYKIMEKIIENGIKPFLSSLVLPNQGGFVENRQIWENIILVQEAIHSIYSRGEKGMVIKIDMENSFDRVKHSFLRDILKKFGFNQSFISWIGACINSPWISPLVNGRLAPFFKATRGLRQEFPLSPLLYVLMAEALNKIYNGRGDQEKF
jgi:hypothetical protein